MRRLARVAAVLLGGLAVGRGAAGEAPGAWWNPSWTVRRELEVPSGRSNLPGREIAYITFLHAGMARKDLRDLRVVSDKGASRHKVIQGGPGDFVRVAFEVVPGAARYWLYYGNPRARAVDTKWKMSRGLLLETRRYRGGDPGSLKGMRGIVAKSNPKMGADFVGQVFHGFNIFGHSENYVSVYKGTINLQETGDYTWVTSSDDASFMLVDGKLVTQWPGWHGASGRAMRHMQRKHRFEKGLHEFEYLHVNGASTGIAAAYWQTPSGKKPVPIPQSAYPSVSRARPKSIEVKGKPFALDFEVTGMDQTFIANRYLSRYRFRNTSKGLAAATVEWDFGDGVTARGPHADHVYLADGEYSVKMTVKHSRGTGSIANRIRAQRLWRRQAEGNIAKPAEFWPVLKGYDTGKLSGKCLGALFDIYGAAGAVDEEREKVARTAMERASEMPDQFLFDAAWFLQNRLRDSGEIEEAIAVLRTAESRLKSNKNLRAKAIREIGDVLFYYVEDLDGALKEYDKVVGRYQGLEDNIVRLTKIKIGDIFRKKRDYEKAAAAYRDAERLKLYKHSDQVQTIRKGMLAQVVEEYLRRGKLDEAAKAMSNWEWEFPMEKLTGRSSLLRAKIAIARKNLEEAAKQLDDFIGVSPKSEYAAECLFVAADVHGRLGRPDIARKYYERLAKEYRDSEFSVPASDKLKELEKKEISAK